MKHPSARLSAVSAYVCRLMLTSLPHAFVRERSITNGIKAKRILTKRTIRQNRETAGTVAIHSYWCCWFSHLISFHFETYSHTIIWSSISTSSNHSKVRDSIAILSHAYAWAGREANWTPSILHPTATWQFYYFEVHKHILIEEAAMDRTKTNGISLVPKGRVHFVPRSFDRSLSHFCLSTN